MRLVGDYLEINDRKWGCECNNFKYEFYAYSTLYFKVYYIVLLENPSDTFSLPLRPLARISFDPIKWY